MGIDDRSVQRALKSAGHYHGLIDGDFGEGSRAAARKWAVLVSPPYKTSWPDQRVRIAIEQKMLHDLGFYESAIDGFAGPATQVGYERWQDYITFHRAPLPDHAVGYQSQVFPRQAGVRAFYGEPGQNQAMLESPYPLYLDWQLTQKVAEFSIHEKCHDAAERAMKRVLDHYGEDEIHRLGLDQFGGCLNVRKMRNGSAWSMHAWGIAIDWDADRNQLRWGRDRAQMAREEYEPFLDAWEAEGFVSLGRLRNFDWMHVQAARL